MSNTPNAEFFDGNSAHAHQSYVTLEGESLTIARADADTVIWRLSELELVSGGKPGQAMRLKKKSDPGSRLILPEGELADTIARGQKHISRGHARRFWKGVAASVACVVVLVGTGYAVLTLAPRALAGYLPDKVVNAFADNLEKSLIKKSKRCELPAGQNALNVMMRRVLSGAEDPPTFSLRVYDMRSALKKPVVNAFALPGGRIVVSSGLIHSAKTPDEVAGVLAHELGHVAHKHPEAAIVRIYGLQVFASIFTGGAGGETVSSIAGLLAVLRHSREAEEEADTYASDIMGKANIDPKGLKAFFTRLMKRTIKRKSKPSAAKSDDKAKTETAESGDKDRQKKQEKKSKLSERLQPLGSIFSTHPPTRERISRLKARPGGSEPEVLSSAQWSDLRRICQ